MTWALVAKTQSVLGIPAEFVLFGLTLLAVAFFSTASNLIFVGDGGGTLFALDAVTGKTLWEHKMLPGVATPVTYELDGKQFVAVLSGTGNGRVFGFALDAAGGKP